MAKLTMRLRYVFEKLTKCLVKYLYIHKLMSHVVVLILLR